MRIAVYPGTFDPMTNGHIDVIERASKLFDKIIVGIAENKQKKPFLSLADRLELGKALFTGIPNIHVESFSGLLVDFALKMNAHVIIRGLRAVSDFEYEFQLARMNKDLSPEIETLFMIPHERYAFVSSSLVREIATLGGDIGKFVPNIVEEKLKMKG
jgi:pantetheine-phosphate adenylyltransferase